MAQEAGAPEWPAVLASAMIPAAMHTVLGQTPDLYHLPGFHEPFSAISHLMGAVLFLYLGALLLRRAGGDVRRTIYLGIYAGSCILLLSLSGVYHMMVRGGTAHQVLERLDHGAIFLLIAGTFTPTHGLLFQGWLRWGPLLLMWAAAITGVTLKTVFFSNLAEAVGLTFYLALGWFGVVTVFLLWWQYGFRFVRPLLLGGVAYSAGSVLEYFGWPVLVPGVVNAHEVFHLAVLAGALFHFRFIWQFADGEVRQFRD